VTYPYVASCVIEDDQRWTKLRHRQSPPRNELTEGILSVVWLSCV
jgi:hypothetical protein